jgi:DNA replication protein DnaC
MQELQTKAQQYCDTCIGLDHCIMPIAGWVPVPPTGEAIELYEGMEPEWSWRKCSHLNRAESEKQQAAAMKGKWQERTLDTFKVDEQNKAAYQACLQYARRINPFIKDGLLIYGSVGTGKTHLAAGILKIAFSRGFDGVLISVPDLLNEIRKSYNGDGERGRIEEKVRNKFIVVLDDLGAENLTDWVREKLFTLINYRYETQKPLIITTNCTPAELTERVDVRITDRLREMCTTVQISGRSRRGRK